MDGRRFDDIARTLAASASRRGVLAGLAAVAAGLVAPRGADAACPPGTISSRGRCLCRTTGRPPTRDGCLCRVAGTYCQGTTCCGGDGCVDLLTDVQHCGSCGNAVATDRGQGCCGGTATQLGTVQNCSTCGDDCNAVGAGFECCPTVEGFQCVASGTCSGPTSTSTFTGTVSPTSPAPTPTSIT